LLDTQAPDRTYEWRDETLLAARKHSAELAAHAMGAQQE
jgi:hypothetical protein